MQKHNDDFLLLKDIQEGDEAAFKRLFDFYYTPLCRYAKLYIENTSEVEDLVLELFVYFWQNCSTIKINISLKSYLFRAVRNRSLNYLRSKQQIVPIETVLKDLHYNDDLKICLDELNQLIEDAISDLPVKCREVFCLSRKEELTNKSIAGKLNISEKTVEGHITKALRAIRDCLKNEYWYLF